MHRIAALLILVAGCASAPATTPQTPQTLQKPPVTQPATTSIGSATMKPDGTLVLQLRADGDCGLVGDPRKRG